MREFIKRKQKDYVLVFGLIAVLALGLFIDNKYLLDIFITTIYFCVIAGAWNIMCGYAGQLSLGHVVFMGVGQYTSTILFVRLGISPWIGMFAGTIVAMILAFFVGLLALRLKSFFFSLSTIALVTIFQVLAIKLDGLTGGSVGISIPYEPSFVNMIFKEYKPSLILFLLLLLAVLLTTTYISKSKLGANLVAMREDDMAASSLGVNLLTNKITALCISAFFTSIAGTLYSQYTLYVDPNGSFNLITSQKAAILTIVGGSGTIFGPVIGGLILGPTEIFLRGWLGSTFQGAYLVIYGILLVVVVLVMPQGIVGAIKNKRTKKARHLQEEMLKAEVNKQHNHVHKKL
ncbi:branched-chain amino acid ABC transporter permease [Vallitalea pronyensis]|uniref:Branched-chain amino acid ABC transporter permease n=1 Tax=Vallitalea pronyensis TaxID=1348613 RepID=A0A8J8MMP9_9FIRM|nr:branched-chain amino acid ABC transporter permease [Vallitalea pronyensis]QUI24306.1 branched-chain amino acid ABC transporter permease [Vallitalea pronyensis]